MNLDHISVSSTHKRTKTLGDILPQSTSNSTSRRESVHPSLRLMGMDWVFLEETSKTLNMKYKQITDKPFLQLPSSSTNSGSKQYAKVQSRYLNAKNLQTSNSNNNNFDNRSSRSTFNQTSRSPNNHFSEGISTGCITTPTQNTQETYTNIRKLSNMPSLLQSTTAIQNTGTSFSLSSNNQSKELRKRYRTDPCRINITTNQQDDTYADINEQEELNYMWSNALDNNNTEAEITLLSNNNNQNTSNIRSEKERAIVDEKVYSILKEVEDEDNLKQQECKILRKYQMQQEKRALSENQNHHRNDPVIHSDKLELNNLQRSGQEAANTEMNENQRLNSKVEESYIPLQAIYNENINLEKDLKQIYFKYEKNPIEIKIPSSQVVKNLVDQRLRRKERTFSTSEAMNMKENQSSARTREQIQQQRENDQQISSMYQDYIQDKINQGYPINKQLKSQVESQKKQQQRQQINLQQQHFDSQIGKKQNSNKCKGSWVISNQRNLDEMSPTSIVSSQQNENKSSTPCSNSNNSNQIYNKLEDFKREMSSEKTEVRSKSVANSRNKKRDSIKLPNLRDKKFTKPYISSTQIESSTPNTQSKSVKSRLYDQYYIKPSQRFQLYLFKIDNINLTKDVQRNFTEEQILFNQK